MRLCLWESSGGCLVPAKKLVLVIHFNSFVTSSEDPIRWPRAENAVGDHTRGICQRHTCCFKLVQRSVHEQSVTHRFASSERVLLRRQTHDNACALTKSPCNWPATAPHTYTHHHCNTMSCFGDLHGFSKAVIWPSCIRTSQRQPAPAGCRSYACWRARASLHRCVQHRHLLVCTLLS